MNFIRSGFFEKYFRLSSLIILLSLYSGASAFAERPRTYAITDVKIVVAPGQVIEKGTIVLRDGFIEAVGSKVTVPSDAQIFKSEESWVVYPSFLDAAMAFGKDEQQGGNPAARRGAETAKTGSPHELKAVRPERAVIDKFDLTQSGIEKHRSLGFAVAQILPNKGVFQGQSAIIALREGDAPQLVLNDRFAQIVKLEASSFMARQYPSSKIGAMATVRQTLLDAERHVMWEEKFADNQSGMQRPEFRSSDAALARVVMDKAPVIFVSEADLDPARFAGLRAEFDLNGMTLAQGLSDHAADLAHADMPILLPLRLPEKLEIKNADDANEVSLKTMQEQLLAPKLPKALVEAKVEFAATTFGLKNTRDFTEALAQAVENGLSEADALQAVTTTPAKLMGLTQSHGTLEAGKVANVLVVAGDLFVKKPVFKHMFVDGYHEEIKAEKTKGDPNAVVDPRGTWEISTTVMGRSSDSTWTITGSKGDWKGFSESERAGKDDFDNVELKGNALTIERSSPNGDIDITVIIEGDELSGDTMLESPRGSAKMEIEGRRVFGPEGEEK